MNERTHQDLNAFSLPFETLGLRVVHIENAMGYYKNGVPEPFPALISKAIEDLAPLIEIRGGYRCFGEIDFSYNRSTLILDNITLSLGRTISKQIKGSEAIVVFTCTIGPGISELSKKFMENGDMIRGYILDTIGSVAVEKAMDVIQEKIAETESQKGKHVTNRFSPGYCEWPIDNQRQLFSLLPAGFCGITLSESSLMLPIKSVSGIIGIGGKVKRLAYPCKICDQRMCFRRLERH